MLAKHYLVSLLVGCDTTKLFISMQPGIVISVELLPSLKSDIISIGSGGCCVEACNPFLRYPMQDCSFIVSNWDSVGRRHSSVKSCRICSRTPARWPASPVCCHLFITKFILCVPTGVLCILFFYVSSPTLPSPQRQCCPIFASAVFHSSRSSLRAHLKDPEYRWMCCLHSVYLLFLCAGTHQG